MRDVMRISKWAVALLGAALVLTLGSGSAQAASGDPKKGPAAEKAKAAPKAQGPVLAMAVTDKGFEPAELRVKKGEPVTLRITRKTDETCATEILVEDTGVNVALPLGKAVDVAFTPEKSGKLKFGCAMNKMIGGVLLVE